VAVYGRAFGQRWFAIGMFAFMSYFTGAYLRPSLDQLPALVLGAGISAAAIAHLVRTVLLPDDRYRDLLRAIASVQQRVDEILHEIAAAAGRPILRAADRRRLHALEERLKEAVLMAESLATQVVRSIIWSLSSSNYLKEDYNLLVTTAAWHDFC